MTAAHQKRNAVGPDEPRDAREPDEGREALLGDEEARDGAPGPEGTAMSLDEVERERRPPVVRVPEDDREEQRRRDRAREPRLLPPKPVALRGAEEEQEDREREEAERVLREEAEPRRDPREVPEARRAVQGAPDQPGGEHPQERARRVRRGKHRAEREQGRDVEREHAPPGEVSPAGEEIQREPIQDDGRRRGEEERRQVDAELRPAEDPRARREDPGDERGVVVVARREPARPLPVVRLVVEEAEARQEHEPDRGEEDDGRSHGDGHRDVRLVRYALGFHALPHPPRALDHGRSIPGSGWVTQARSADPQAQSSRATTAPTQRTRREEPDPRPTKGRLRKAPFGWNLPRHDITIRLGWAPHRLRALGLDSMGRRVEARHSPHHHTRPETDAAPALRRGSHAGPFVTRARGSRGGAEDTP